MRVILVTGGAGFIGSNFIRYFMRRNKNYIIVNLDKLTYAGNTENLKDIFDCPRYHFIKGDICNAELVNYILRKMKPAFIINFAAESHVDKSIYNPTASAETNFMGTLTLLNGALSIWKNGKFRGNRFLQISTDEVYGSNEDNKNYFTEESNLAPGNPYSASKASADMMVKAFVNTYGLPAIITRCCNNYGPYQNIEKFLPLCISRAIKDELIPVYGNGKNVREWIHVLDHCTALIRTLFYGKPGEIYNIGSGEEISNIEMAGLILKYLDKPSRLIRLVEDRPGHDRRYALNSYKIKNDTGWSCHYNLKDGISDTVRWYAENCNWWEKSKEGDK